MSWKKFFRRRRRDEDFSQELEAHLLHEIDRNVGLGLPSNEARAAALRKFGNITSTKEKVHEMNTISIIETSLQDLRHGGRLLWQNKTFAAVAILSLALGMGANTAIFQLLDAVRLRALPVMKPQELAEVQIVAKGGRTGSFISRRPTLTYPLLEQIRARQQSFSDLIAWGATRFNLNPSGEVRRAQGLWVSGSFFRVLGVPAIHGRVFTAEDDVRGCSNVGAIISHGFWQREFGGEPSAIGRKILLDGRPFEVTGITPPGFFGVEVGQAFDVALPLCARSLIVDGPDILNLRDTWWLAVIGRLKPGKSLDSATADLQSISPDIFRETLPARYQPDDAKSYLNFTLRSADATSGVSTLRRDYETPLWILMATTGFVLLIACANIANLMLARASARQREISIRLAIGASRRRVIRQLFAESFLLAAIGGACAIVMAGACSRLLVSFLSTDQNGLFLTLSMDWRTMAFVAGLIVATCLVFGLVPAFRATLVSPGSAMKASGRGLTSSRERLGFRRGLAVSQVALSLVLLIGALLFARSFRNLLVLDLGFRQEGVLIANVDMRRLSASKAQLASVYNQLDERLPQAAQVESAAQVYIVPISGSGWNNNVFVADDAGKREKGLSNFNEISQHYFKTMGISMIAGRDFDSGDTLSSSKKAIVDEPFVQKFMNGVNPIGRRFEIEASPGEALPQYEIVGVVQNSKYGSLRDEFSPTIYLPASQNDDPHTATSYVLRSSAPVAALTASVKRLIAEIHPEIAISFQVLDTSVRNSLVRERLMATLTGFFGLVAAMLSTIGLYGMLSYTVTQRRNEIGIRMALGANRKDVVWMILREAGLVVSMGLVIGTGATLLTMRTADSLLYGLTSRDPTTLVVAISSLTVIAFLAGYIPARRAATLEPTNVLREE